MGNKSVESLRKINCLSLDDFQKEIKRKLTVHILSNNKKNCRILFQCLSGENFSINSYEILKKNIKKK